MYSVNTFVSSAWLHVHAYYAILSKIKNQSFVVVFNNPHSGP